MTNKSIKIECGSNEYSNIHRWINRHYGRPQICESTKCDGTSKIYQWALKKTKEHYRDKTHYLRLCKKCHFKYDLVGERLKKFFSKTVIKISPNGKETEYSSVREASEKNNVSKNGVWLILIGRNKRNKYGDRYIYKDYKPNIKKSSSQDPRRLHTTFKRKQLTV